MELTKVSDKKRFQQFVSMDGELNEQTTNSSVLEEGTILARDLIDYKLGRGMPPANPTAKTLRKLSDDIENRNPLLLEQLCTKLNFSTETGYSSFSEIAKEVFSDGIINWGRIAVLFAFGAKLGKHCKENNMTEQLDNIPEWIGRFVMGHSDWIERQGGWSNFNTRFQELGENNSSWWKSALITTAFGIGSLAVLTICK
ncbi:Bcl-2 family protein [Salmonella sp. s51933]|uniref:Bcl-2 family protein n=2 Tax=unclassified Salmonella TaxID=2614656 RepID=UPI003754586D